MSAARAFPRRLEALEEIFAFTSDAFAAERIDPGLRTTVDFVLEELFTNVVKYGRKSESAVRVELARVPGGVEATLIDDDAERFDPTESTGVDIHLPIGQRDPGGLGLHLVRKLVDSMEYRYLEERRQGRITFRKTLEGAAQGGGENARD